MRRDDHADRDRNQPDDRAVVQSSLSSLGITEPCVPDGSYQHHLLDLAAYLVLLGLLASLLGLAATRAWGRVGTPESDAVNSDDQDLRSAVGERWSTLDAGVLFAQPVIGFMCALALSVRVDNVPPIVGTLSRYDGDVSTALLVIGFVTGCVLTGLLWRRMRVGATPMSRAAVVAMSLLALPWIAFFVAGGQFGAPATNLAWAPVILDRTTPGEAISGPVSRPYDSPDR